MTKAFNKILRPAKTVDGGELSHDKIDKRLKVIAGLIEEHYGPWDGDMNTPPLFVEVKFGAFIIYSMLATKFRVEFPFFVGAVRAKSYQENGVHTPAIILEHMFDCELTNRRVLIIDDIVESGGTLVKLKSWFEEQGVADVRTFALLDKPSKRKFDIVVDWVGFELQPDQWVVGLGLDDNNLFRHFNNIVVATEPKTKGNKKPR